MSEKWTLSISNGLENNRKLCTGIAINNTLLQFETGKPAHEFRTSKEAWYFWYRFRKYYPDKCKGFFAEVRLVKKESGHASK